MYCILTGWWESTWFYFPILEYVKELCTQPGVVTVNFRLKRILPHEVQCYPVNLAFYFCGKILGGKGKIKRYSISNKDIKIISVDLVTKIRVCLTQE